MTGEALSLRRSALGLLPPTAVLELTYACNHACIFCSCPWYAGDFEIRPEMSLDEWEAAIAALVSRGVSSFAFTGGEPLLKDGWRDIVRFVSTLHVAGPDGAERPALYLVSNGRAMTPSDLQFLADHDVRLMLSLPGLETYAEHTGGGDPDRVLDLFEGAASLGMTTTVGVTITRRNLHETYTTIGSALLAGAGSLLLNRFLPGGRGLTRWRELLLDGPSLQQMLDEADAALRDARRHGRVGTELAACSFDPARLERLDVGTRCGGADSFFVVDPSGYVRVCNHSPKRLVHWTELDRIWSEPHWRRFALHEHPLPGCDGCSASSRCDAGCPAAMEILADAGGGDALMPPLRTLAR